VVGGKEKWGRNDLIGLGILVATVAGIGVTLLTSSDSTPHSPTLTLPSATAADKTTVPSSKGTITTTSPTPEATVEQALRQHFSKIEKGNYTSAWRDLTGQVVAKVGPEARWIKEQQRNKPHGVVLAVNVRMLGESEAEAKINEFKTYEAGHRWCFKGDWALVDTSTGWAIYNDSLKERTAC